MRTVNFYRGSPIRPGGDFLRKLYLKYIQKKIREDRRILAELDGIKYNLDLSQGSEFEAYYGGGYEPTVIKIINEYVKLGDTVMDIGARIGLHTLRMKKLVGEKGRVIAIEPDENIFPTLLENARLNNYSIVAENKAFSDKNMGKEMTLDAYFDKEGINRLDFIKLDTDGWEYKILRGGLATIKKFKPVMVIEFNRELLENDRLEEMIDLLDSLGYSFFQGRNLKEYLEKSLIIAEVAIKGNINILCK